MSVTSIPKRTKGLLDPKAYFFAVVKSLDEVPWDKDYAKIAFRGEVEIEGIAKGSSTEPFDPWMAKKVPISFYIPEKGSVDWDTWAYENFGSFAEACDVEADAKDENFEFDPEQVIGKTILIQMKGLKGDGTPSKFTRNDGTVGLKEEQQEISKYYHVSFWDK